MKSTFTKLLAVVIVLIFSIGAKAEDKVSDWKLFTPGYVFADGTYQEITQPALRNKVRVVNDVAAAPNDDIYIATSAGLFVFSGGKLGKYGLKGNNFTDAYAVEFDSKGDMWIGVTGRLIRVKPSGEFVNFTKEEHPGFEMAEVREIVIDKNDNVWVVGRKNLNTKQGAGISFYDGSKWTNYQDNLEKPFVEDLTIDSEGNIWAVMGRQDMGVVMFDGSNWNFFNPSNSALKTTTVRTIAAGSNGKVYFGTDMGLTVYDKGQWENVSLTEIFKSKFLTKLAAIGQPEITALAVDKDDVLWIGTKNEGVIRLNGESRVMMDVDNSPLTSNSIRNISIDRNNAKWIMTGFYYENVKDFMLETGMTEQEMGRSFNGVVMYNEPDYSQYPGHEVHNYYTEDLPIASFYEAAANSAEQVYLSTSNNVLEYTATGWVEIATNEVEHEDKGALKNLIQSVASSGEIAIAPDNTMWVLARDVMRIKGSEIARWRKDENDLGPLMNGLAIDGNGTIWFANNKGLCSFDGTTFNCKNKKDGIPDMRINEVFVDKEGKIWIGLYAGAAVFDGTVWTEYSKKEGGLEGTWCQSIIQRKNGDICVGTGKGVGVFKGSGDWEMITEPKDLINFWQVTALAEDAYGNLLIGTKDDGVLILENDGAWKHFGTENSGLPHDEVKHILATGDGIWVITGRTDRSFSSSPTSATPGTPDPAADIKSKISEFDPRSAVTFFKLQQ